MNKTALRRSDGLFLDYAKDKLPIFNQNAVVENGI